MSIRSNMVNALMGVFATKTDVQQVETAMAKTRTWIDDQSITMSNAVTASTPVEIPVVFRTPAPAPDFSLAASVIVPLALGSLLGKVQAQVKPGSQTVNGCTVQVINTGLLTLTAGAVVHVIAARGYRPTT